MKNANILFQGEQLGGKATQLIRLVEAGFNVPDFAIIPAEFHAEKVAQTGEASITEYTFSTLESDVILAGLPKNCEWFSVR